MDSEAQASRELTGVASLPSSSESLPGRRTLLFFRNCHPDVLSHTVTLAGPSLPRLRCFHEQQLIARCPPPPPPPLCRHPCAAAFASRLDLRRANLAAFFDATQLVSQIQLLDPVCLLLFLPKVARAFLHPIKSAMPLIERILLSFVTQEMGISHTLHRHFWWYAVRTVVVCRLWTYRGRNMKGGVGVAVVTGVTCWSWVGTGLCGGT